MNKTFLLALAVVLFLTGCNTQTAKPVASEPAPIIPAAVSASGKLLPKQWANVAAPVGGRVVLVKVQTGDQVQAEQVLVQLDDTDAKLALAQAKAALQTAQAQLGQTKAGARPAEIAAAEQGVRQAEAAVAGAKAQLAQLQAGARAAEIAAAESDVVRASAALKQAQDAYDGVSQGRAAAKEYGIQVGGLGQAEEQMRVQLAAARASQDAAQKRLEQLKAGPTHNEILSAYANVESAVAQKDRAQAQLDLLKAGASKEQIAVAEANVATAQVAVEQAQAQLTKTQIKAPFGGTVGNVYVREGEMITPGQPVAALGDLRSLRVETTDLSEVDVARVEVGLPVNVTFDALPGKTLTGKVARIAPMSSQGQGGVNYTVIVELDQLDPTLRWGMTAFTDIQVK